MCAQAVDATIDSSKTARDIAAFIITGALGLGTRGWGLRVIDLLLQKSALVRVPEQATAKLLIKCAPTRHKSDDRLWLLFGKPNSLLLQKEDRDFS
jgi:hypothetical protein